MKISKTSPLAHRASKPYAMPKVYVGAPAKSPSEPSFPTSAPAKPPSEPHSTPSSPTKPPSEPHSTPSAPANILPSEPSFPTSAPAKPPSEPHSTPSSPTKPPSEPHSTPSAPANILPRATSPLRPVSVSKAARSARHTKKPYARPTGLDMRAVIPASVPVFEQEHARSKELEASTAGLEQEKAGSTAPKEPEATAASDPL
ncbi:hypothetical protein OE88DRAFT_1740426 [Heliocybe sulcata]|uniref:Uncharacterized protein n=1 Tax=Heliocybe sulcata TaxID=5364 RepID=A0A5C3MV35_9AGAM|nr:hypothetical protein OE88DRAFT_1740426 [Heliocybe sulcata]